jgi:hypothetical protein
MSAFDPQILIGAGLVIGGMLSGIYSSLKLPIRSGRMKKNEKLRQSKAAWEAAFAKPSKLKGENNE